MSERAPKNHEAHIPHIDTSSESRHNLEWLQQQANSKEHAPAHEVEHLRKEIHTTAKESSETAVGQQPVQPLRDFGMHHQLKAHAYTRTLHQIQAHLSPRERSASRFIHRRSVEKASDIGAKTIARPSGVLMGGSFAFIGSTMLLYFSKHYGFHYNYLFALALFVAGFALGLLIELISRPFIAKKRKYSS